MNNFVNDVLETLSAGMAYLKAGVAVVMQSPALLVTTILLALSAGKSFKLGKLIEIKSK